MAKFKVMCNVYFNCQDGYDCMTHDDGEVYETLEEAKKVCKEYQKEDGYCNHEFYVEEVEE